MPPTRGHDLKLSVRAGISNTTVDAPHTGARLETLGFFTQPLTELQDAPHTGARLETGIMSSISLITKWMPPTGGHDLKLDQAVTQAAFAEDAPHTGARLETVRSAVRGRSLYDAPHTGARLETLPGSALQAPAAPGCPPHGGTT